MPELTPIQLEDGTFIYIQATENIAVPTPKTVKSNQQEETPSKLDFLSENPENSTDRDFNPQQQVTQSFQAIESTVRTYTTHLLNSFKNIATAEVSEVTLEFGVNVGGIPYIATGNTNCKGASHFCN